jgi:hypothetical protein
MSNSVESNPVDSVRIVVGTKYTRIKLLHSCPQGIDAHSALTPFLKNLDLAFCEIRLAVVNHNLIKKMLFEFAMFKAWVSPFQFLLEPILILPQQELWIFTRNSDLQFRVSKWSTTWASIVYLHSLRFNNLYDRILVLLDKLEDVGSTAPVTAQAQPEMIIIDPSEESKEEDDGIDCDSNKSESGNSDDARWWTPFNHRAGSSDN